MKILSTNRLTLGLSSQRLTQGLRQGLRHELKQGGKLLAALSLMLSLWLAYPTLSWAAEPVPAEPVPAEPAVTKTTDIPSEKIAQFARAYVQIVTLIGNRASELQTAETEAESLKVEQSIQAEAFRLMQANELEVDEYLQLLGLANQDADFRDRILAEIESAAP
ncbi:MAG: DUF4168 domain-containing protein [Leptolyngbya sp. SIO4C1]|nr:DUF4168 domain-containing protein [Leptolyngbya sp. SIO4C1]